MRWKKVRRSDGIADSCHPSVNVPRVFAETPLSIDSIRVQTAESILSAQGGAFMKCSDRLLAGSQETGSHFTNLAFICLLFALLVALPATCGAESVSVHLGLVEYSGGQDPDPEPVQRPQDEQDEDDDTRARLEEAWAKLQKAVAAGELTAEEARTRYDSLLNRLKGRADGGESKDDAGDDPTDDSLRRIEEANRRIQEAITAGEITTEQGRERLEALRERFAAARERVASADDAAKAVADTERQLREAGTKLREAIAAGEMTREEARARFEELRKKLTAEKARAAQQREQARPKPEKKRNREGAAIRARLEAAIESGAMTWEQARDKYIELMEKDDRGRGALIRARLEEGIAAGKITEDQAVEIYIEMMEEGQQDSDEKQAGDEKEPPQRTFTRQQYADAQARMEKMVEAGEITAEQMKQRLGEMRKRIGGTTEKKETSQRTFTRQQYADAQARMKKMVEEGKITAEQMEERLASMRKLIKD
ncbi:MAG: hypothetical protein VX764_09455 [Planctomycetota bacterium]|nr:hypothetical protein [Planctomycetota bacterium]